MLGVGGKVVTIHLILLSTPDCPHSFTRKFVDLHSVVGLHARLSSCFQHEQPRLLDLVRVCIAIGSGFLPSAEIVETPVDIWN